MGARSKALFAAVSQPLFEVGLGAHVGDDFCELGVLGERGAGAVRRRKGLAAVGGQVALVGGNGVGERVEKHHVSQAHLLTCVWPGSKGKTATGATSEKKCVYRKQLVKGEHLGVPFT